MSLFKNFRSAWREGIDTRERERLLETYLDALAIVIQFSRNEQCCANPACESYRTTLTSYRKHEASAMVRATGMCADCGATFMLDADTLTFVGMGALHIYDRLDAQDDADAIGGLDQLMMGVSDDYS